MRLQRYVETVVRHAWPVMALTLLATALLGRQASRIEANFDMDASFPTDHRIVRLDREIRSQFGGKNFVIMAVVPKKGTVWQVPVLQIVSRLTGAVLRLPHVIGKDVISLSSPNVRRVEDSDWGIKEEYLMRDPPATAADVARVRAVYDATSVYQGVVVSENQRAALLFADFWDDARSEDIARAVAETASRFSSDDIEILFTGEPVLSNTELNYVKGGGLQLAMAGTFLIVMVVLLASFRSIQGMLVPMVTAALSTIWGFGWMQLAHIPLGIWNSAVPILIIAVAAGHSAQMLKRYYEELGLGLDNHDAVIEATTKIGPVMLAAGGTAALGFASLALFGVPSMRDFGLSTAFGIASAVVLEMSFVPAFRSRLRAGGAAPVATAAGDRFLNGLARTLQEHPARTVLAFTVVMAFAAGGIAQITTGRSARAYIPHGTARDHLNRISEFFPGTMTFTVLFDGKPGMAKDPQVLDMMYRMQRRLERDPAIARTSSVADLIEYVNRVFDPQAEKGIPQNRRLVAQLIFLSQSPAYERFVDRSFARAVVWAYLRTEDTRAIARLLSTVSDFAAHNSLGDKGRIRAAGGTGPLMFALNEHATKSKLLNILVVLFAIYVISSAVLRTPLGGLFVVTPLVVTTVVNLGALGWSRTPLDMVTASSLAASVGIGADYSIYLLYRMREERARISGDTAALQVALRTSGRAVMFVAIAISAGFLPLAVSSYPAFRLSGTLTPLAMLVSCATAMTLMPALVSLIRPSFVYGRRPSDGQELASELRA